MSTDRFTPGPYLLEGLLIYSLEPCGWRKGVEQFENRFSAHLQPGRNCPLVEAQSTATLLAASWDLLKALERLHAATCAELSSPVSLTETQMALNFAADAIAKARGEGR